MTTIIEFVDARLIDAELHASQSANMEQMQRDVDFKRQVWGQIKLWFDSNPDEEVTDHPLAAGLIPLAHIWCDHPDYQPRDWFPHMIEKLEQEPDPRKRGPKP